MKYFVYAISMAFATLVATSGASAQDLSRIHGHLDHQMQGGTGGSVHTESVLPAQKPQELMPQRPEPPAAVIPYAAPTQSASAPKIGRSDNHVMRWQMAPLRPGKERWNLRVGYADIEAEFVHNNPYVEKITFGKLPRDYGMELRNRLDGPNPTVFRAACKQVSLVFSNMGEVPLPRLFLPVKSRHGNSMRAMAELAVVFRNGTRGFLSSIISLEQTHGGRPLRLPFPVEYIDRVPNPIVAFKVFDEHGEVDIMHLPAGADDQNAMISLPNNAKYGSVNDLKIAAERGARLFMIVVPANRCLGRTS